MSERASILLVEDEPDLVRGLSDALEFEGFEVRAASGGQAALAMARDVEPACIILDLMLPDMNGYQVCESLREAGSRTPILMLTARSQEADKIRGLEVGADDYMTKPFSLGELVARVRALLRRASYQPTDQLRIGEVDVDLGRHQLTRGDKSETLTPNETELLRLLVERAGAPVSRDDILETVWGPEARAESRTVDNLVVKLRRKLEVDHKDPRHIVTVYGIGYKLVP